MKKSIAIILAILMLLSLAACGEKTEAEQAPEEKTAAEPAQEIKREEPAAEEPKAVTEEPKAPETPVEEPAETTEPVEEPEPEPAPEEPVEPEEPAEPEPAFRNALTGEACTEEQYSMRPYAIVYNYASLDVSKVQTGLYRADVILEMYTESYTTRLLAFFKDITGIGPMGTLRSSRIDFARMAHAYDAIFVHVGGDPTYGADYLREENMVTANFNLYYNDNDGHVFWYREDTGLPTEHTLYSTDEMIKYCVKFRNIVETTEDNAFWFDFALHGEPECLAEGEECSYLSVPFNKSHSTNFTYDPLSGLYTRYFNDYMVIDCKTSAPTLVKNILVFPTTAYPYADSNRMKISFKGGEGWYASEGKIIPILWSVDENERFVVKDVNGEPMQLNPGKTWICMNQNDLVTTWEP